MIIHQQGVNTSIKRNAQVWHSYRAFARVDMEPFQGPQLHRGWKEAISARAAPGAEDIHNVQELM